MSINLSIKNASDEIVAALKLRAQQNHRSLQGELMAIIENAAAEWLSKSETRGLREIAAEWRAKDQAAAAGQQALERRIEHAPNEAVAADSDGREQDIRHLIDLLEKGLPFGKRRSTRDEMHER
jgi:plasmid stability protein